MKPVKAWMLVCDDKPVTDGTGRPLIYGKKQHAEWDCRDNEWHIVGVEIREVERKGTMSSIVEWLRKEVHHYECEDCWYSCATMTCDEQRRGDDCDCGAEYQNAKRTEAANEIVRLEKRVAALEAGCRAAYEHSNRNVDVNVKLRALLEQQ